MFTHDADIDEAEFNRLALEIFRYQFANNRPYALYCAKRKRTPDRVSDWREIPAVPTAAFKELDLVAGSAADAKLVFQTSGTTRGAQKRGRHYILSPATYEASLLAGFKRFVLRDVDRIRVISLMPAASELTDSSLAYMLDHVMRAFGTADSEVVATAGGGVDSGRLHEILSQTREPVCLLGTSLAYLHWLESTDEKYTLPAGSRLMDTGGFKGERREISPADLRAWYHARLALPAQSCFNEYGMTELCSQYYSAADNIKRAPPWLRFRILDPDTLAEAPRGEAGILQHVDLANRDSVLAVLTEDLAVAQDDGFVLQGRVPGAMPRGCSIAMDMLLSDAAKR